jgi:hypothetical protein
MWLRRRLCVLLIAAFVCAASGDAIAGGGEGEGGFVTKNKFFEEEKAHYEKREEVHAQMSEVVGYVNDVLLYIRGEIEALRLQMEHMNGESLPMPFRKLARQIASFQALEERVEEISRTSVSELTLTHSVRGEL